MTREEVIEILERFVIGAKPCSQREIVDACASAYRMLKEQPSLPSNLDEAAEKYADKVDNDAYYNDEWINQEDISNAFKAGAEWMQNKMFSMRFENEPLDSAARNVFKEWIPMEVLTIDGIDGGIPLYNQGALIMMFDAGAKWMTKQGETIEGVVNGNWRNQEDAPYEIYVTSDCLPKDTEFKFGDKVVVQIRKE